VRLSVSPRAPPRPLPQTSGACGSGGPAGAGAAPTSAPSSAIAHRRNDLRVDMDRDLLGAKGAAGIPGLGKAGPQSGWSQRGAPRKAQDTQCLGLSNAHNLFAQPAPRRVLDKGQSLHGAPAPHDIATGIAAASLACEPACQKGSARVPQLEPYAASDMASPNSGSSAAPSRSERRSPLAPTFSNGSRAGGRPPPCPRTAPGSSGHWRAPRRGPPQARRCPLARRVAFQRPARGKQWQHQHAPGDQGLRVDVGAQRFEGAHCPLGACAQGTRRAPAPSA